MKAGAAHKRAKARGCFTQLSAGCDEPSRPYMAEGTIRLFMDQILYQGQLHRGKVIYIAPRRTGRGRVRKD